ncbi:MAG: tyrosine-type recombinase/integrase [Bacillota bacterium]
MIKLKLLYLAKNGSDNLDALLAGFEEQIRSSDRGRSARAYLGDVRKFAGWIIGKYGSFKAHAVSPLDLVEYKAYLQQQGGREGKGAAPATVNRALISLRLFFDWLDSTGQVKDNPAASIKRVKVAQKPAPKWLTRNEQAALVRIVREGGNSRDGAMINLMLHAGLRVSELCSLKREHVHISARAGKVCVTGKGNKYREVPLNSTIRKIIERWLDDNPAGSLFPNYHGRPITTRGIFKIIAEYGYRAKLKEVTPHTLRHTFCKNAIDMGIPIDQVAAMAGHSSLDITKIYTQPSEADLQAAVERMAWE